MSENEDAVNVGVKVDPSGVESGSRTAAQAMDKNLTDAADRVTQAFNKASVAGQKWQWAAQNTINPTRESTSEMLKLDNQLAQMMSRIDPAYGATLRLSNAMALLDANLEAGNITAAKHAEMLGKLQTGFSGATGGAKKLNFATAGVSREMIVLAHESLFGHNWSRIPGSLMVLMERTGGLGRALAALTSPAGIATTAIIGVGAAVMALAVHVINAEESLTKLQAGFAGTGRAGMVSRDEIQQFVEKLQLLPGVSRQVAVSITESFAQARGISADLMTQVIAILADYSYMTGQKIPDAAKQLIKAFEDPAAGAKNLDRALGILSADQLREIQTSVASGEQGRAQAIILEALRARVSQLSEEERDAAQSTEGFKAAWDRFLSAVGNTGPIQAAAGAIEHLMHLMGAKMGDMGSTQLALQDELKTVDSQMSQRQAALKANIPLKDRAIIEKQLNNLLTERMSILHTIAKNSAEMNKAPLPGKTLPVKQVAQDQIKNALSSSEKYLSLEERRKAVTNEIAAIEKGIAAAKSTGKTADVQILEARKKEAIRQLALVKLPGIKKPKKTNGMATEMETWRAELEGEEESDGNYFADDTAREIVFWQKKLAVAKAGSKTYVEVYRTLYQLQKTQAKQNLDAQVADIKANAEKFKTGSMERVTAARDVAKLIGNTYGLESRQYKAAMGEIETAQRAHVLAMRQMAQQEISAKLQNAKTLNNIERDRLSFEVSIGQMTSDERLAALKRLEMREYRQELAALNQKSGLAGTEAIQRQQLNGQIEQLELSHQRKMAQLNQQIVEQAQSRWTAFWQPITSSAQSAFNSLIMKTQNWRQAFNGVLSGILTSFETMLGRMVSQWAAKTALMKSVKAFFGIESAFSVVKGGAQAAGSAPQEIAEGANTTAVAANTIGSGANTTALGVLTAAVVANTTALGLNSGTNLLPFATGAWELPTDTPAMVHKGEMIIPANPAAKLRASLATSTIGPFRIPSSVSDLSMTAPAAMTTEITASSNSSNSKISGGDTHVHLAVSAIDGKSVQRFLRDNRTALARQIKTSIRDGGLRVSGK